MNAGLDLGGNKVRQLEFLLADALARGADCVLTTGALNSNHARATAVAAKLLGLEAHLVLCAPNPNPVLCASASVGCGSGGCGCGGSDGGGGGPGPSAAGLDGNLLLSRLSRAVLHVGDEAAFAERGWAALLDERASALRRAGRRPYTIPKGGSNSVGLWGYLCAVDEMLRQLGGEPPNHIVVAADTAGTAAGLALGLLLCGVHDCRVHAVAVGASPAQVHARARELAAEMGLPQLTPGLDRVLRVHDGRRGGYGVCDDALARAVAETAGATGVLLEPTYTGKALLGFAEAAAARPSEFAGARVLFWHTGGALGSCGLATQLYAPAMHLLPPLCHFAIALPPAPHSAHGAGRSSSAGGDDGPRDASAMSDDETHVEAG
jgi:1-aminocyclopropane-1-carboxylate deaminase/D-cysteine desulfhydrase-like pyridoxal-dependent ACC family enzyme